MAQLIVGHTAANSTRIWVRGDRLGFCDITLSSRDTDNSHAPSRRIELNSATDFTGIAVFDELSPNNIYDIEARFDAQSGERVVGRVRTLPNDSMYDFGFVLSSCNLSVTSINNLLSMALVIGGARAAQSSLGLPVDRWKWPWLRLRPLAKRVLELFIDLAGGVQKATGLKQPGQPFLRSPFLKLSAIFESQILVIQLKGAPETIPLAAGDIVTAGGVRGIAASTPVWKSRKGYTIEVVVAQASKQFPIADQEFRRVPVFRERVGVLPSAVRRIGTIIKSSYANPWYEEPAFFLHAGDQIYYDFPLPSRLPERAQYRLAYREAWSDDENIRYVLAHWPHYMIFDDHEFADQFARDFVTPSKESKAEDYLREGGDAYAEYVSSRNPVDPYHPKRNEYSFSVGAAHFFVLDTRTQRYTGRCGHRPQMIGPHQMNALKRWLCDHRADVKFVVTGVPFVAEYKEDETKAGNTWYGKVRKNADNDKWSAPAFLAEREEIIDHIATERIERVVFLTGDVHSCYHASMRIAMRKKNGGSLAEIQEQSHTPKYESLIVHELAAGPANQLELGENAAFVPRCKKATRQGVLYDIALERFHGEANAVMHIAVGYVDRERIVGKGGRGKAPEVVWSVIRTITDSPPKFWTPKQAQKSRESEAVMAGRIVFTPQRTPQTLLDWDSAGRNAETMHAHN